MDEFRYRLENKLKERIEAHKDEMTKALRKREYLVSCGAIQTLKYMLVLCEEVEKEINP